MQEVAKNLYTFNNTCHSSILKVIIYVLHFDAELNYVYTLLAPSVNIYIFIYTHFGNTLRDELFINLVTTAIFMYSDYMNTFFQNF